jgi:hypothetical protein
MDTVTCPHCGTGTFDPARIVDGFATCSGCGRRAATTYLGEQVWLEQQDTLLHARLDWVRQQVSVGSPPLTAPASPGDQRLPVPPSPGHTPWSSAAPRPAPHPGGPVPVLPGQGLPGQGLPGQGAARPGLALSGVQTLLLGTGAVLLVTAAAVFVAVTWDLLGPVGQLASLGVVVAALSGAAHAARTRFRGTAEALAAVAACVTVVALLAAPALGLVTGWWQSHGAAWATLAFTLTASLAVGLTALSRLLAWRVTAIAGLLAAAQSATFAAGGDAGVPAAAPAVLAVAAALLLRLRPTPGARTGWSRDLGWLGSGLAALALLDVLAGYAHLDAAAWWGLSWAVIAGLGAVITGLPEAAPAAGPVPPTTTATPPSATNPASGVGAVVLGLGVGQALAFAVRALDLDPDAGLPLLGVLGAALLATTLLPDRRLPGPIAPRPTLSGAAGAVSLWAIAIPAMLSAGALGPHTVAAFFGIIAVSTYALSLLPGRDLVVVPAAMCAVIGLQALDADPSVILPLLGALGTALLVTTLIPRLRRHGPAGAVAVWFTALPAAATDYAEVTQQDVAIFLAIVAASGYVLALTPRRGFVSWPAAAAGSVSTWLALDVAGYDTLEFYTGTSAATLLVAGLLQRRDVPRLGSVVTLGPALAMAILPSAIDAFGEAVVQEAGTLRAVLVILVAAVLAAVGAALRVRAAFLVGLTAALLAGLGQLFALTGLLPRWVALAAGGALLLGTGFAAEAVRTAGRQFRVFTGQLR